MKMEEVVQVDDKSDFSSYLSISFSKSVSIISNTCVILTLFSTYKINHQQKSKLTKKVHLPLHIKAAA